MQPRRRHVPALAPLSAPQTDEERKARQRLHVKRNYYKKLNELQAQRDRVRQLEDEQRRLAAQQQARLLMLQSSTPPSPDSAIPDLIGNGYLEEVFDGVVDETLTVPTPTTTTVHHPSSLHQQYTEIALLKEQLIAENQRLRDLIADHERTAHKLTLLMQTEDVVQDPSTSYYVGTLQQPVSLAFCHEVAQAAYEEMRVSRTSRDLATLSINVFGWHDKRISLGDRVRYAIKKRFLGYSALELSSRAWGVFSTTTSCEAMYSSTNVKYSIVQIVDDDNIIMLCVFPSPDKKRLAKTLFLLTRLKTPNGFVIGFKDIDAKLLVPSELPVGMSEQWVKHLTCATFTAVGDNHEHCEIEFSGNAEPNPLVPQGEWLLEMLFNILRFEGLLIGPVFSLS